MKNTTLAISALVTLSAVQGASAAVAVFTSYNVWDSAVTDNGQTVAIENFNTYSPGTATSLTGSPLPASGITWTATAPMNGLVTDGAAVRTAAATDALVFDFAPGVQGIGGNIYTSDLGQGKRFAFIEVTLADGVSYFGNSDNAEMFIGFYSDSAAIVKVTISTYQVPKQFSYATIDNLYFAIKPDADGDGVVDAVDNCPATPNSNQLNTDGDTRGDACDNCPLIANSSQADCNNNSVGDACEIASGAPDFNQDTIPDTCQCIADLVLADHQVNGADLGALLSQWGLANPNTVSDMNRDGKVDGADLGHLLASWGPCPN